MQTGDLSTLFAALADPTRRAILARLSEGDAPVKDLVAPFGMTGPAITKHLKVLERAGLISRSREGQQRPCRLEARALAPAADWIEQYRAAWEDQLDRLGAFLSSVAARSPARGRATARGSDERPRNTKARGARGRRNGRTK